MAKAYVKDGALHVEVPFDQEGKVTASRKNILHATTEAGTPDALSISIGNKRVFVQVNAWSTKANEPKAQPVK